MTRINTNVDSLIALSNLDKSNRALGTSLTRLSTGLRVNSGKDDPAGLFTGEFLQQEIGSLRSAIANNNRANNVLATADAALAQVATLLDDIKGILTTTANKGVVGNEEADANQLAIDSAIQSIDRIAGTTQFAGRKLLDGSLGFQLSGAPLFDSGSATLTSVNVHLANFDANLNPIAVQVTLTSRALQATVNAAVVTAAEDASIEVIGNLGAITIRIGSGQRVDAALNGVSDVTGVTASGTLLRSVDYGKDSFVRLQNIIGTVISASEINDQGSDSVGTINGQSFTGRGLSATLRTANLDIDVTFSAGAGNNSFSTFDIQSGGAKFQLGGDVDVANQINIGVNSFFAANLGSVYRGAGGVIEDRTLASIATGGSNTIRLNRVNFAQQIVEDVVNQVTTARSRLGSLQKNTIETNLNSLQVAVENLSAARSQLVDTDFAVETAELTRAQILVQAGQQSLAIANARPRNVLNLLQSQ